ncbi:MAG: hypothetical protein IJV15_07975 [Lachnospiraceae bacterium]|nr:hypothetical protein [Lachnospiraceae bacterium]
MKTIVYAWIEQVLEFPTIGDYQAYIADLNRSPKAYKVIEEKNTVNGITVRIRKQYNNNAFPTGDQKGRCE